MIQTYIHVIQTYIHSNIFYMIQTYIHVTVYPFKKSMSDPFGLPKFESNRTNKLLKNEKKNSFELAEPRRSPTPCFEYKSET